MREFSVFFFAEAAIIMDQAELRVKDFLAIHKPIIFRNPMFSRARGNTFDEVFMVGKPGGNRITSIYGKIKQSVRVGILKDLRSNIRLILRITSSRKSGIKYRRSPLSYEDYVRYENIVLTISISV